MLLLFLLALPVSAEEGEDSTTLPPEYEDMLGSLPDALKDSLPDRVFTSDPAAASEAWEALLSPRGLFTLVISSLSEGWPSLLSLFLQLCGVLLVRAILNCLTSSLRAPALCGGVQLLCRVVLFGLLLNGAMEVLSGVVDFYQDLFALTAAFLPLMGSMYALGGNVSAAVTNHSTLILFLSLIDWIGGQTVVPLFCLCLAFTIPGVFNTSVAGRMAVVTGKLKKWYTTGLALIMLLLSAALGTQTTLAAAADNMAFRTVRFAVSSSIPLVGGGVAEMLRTAAAGVGWLRSIVGLGGVLLLLWLLLPRIVLLWLTRTLYSLGGDVAAFLDCGEEGRLLGELSSLFGYLLAIVSLSAMTFLLALLLLVKCGAAYGG